MSATKRSWQKAALLVAFGMMAGCSGTVPPPSGSDRYWNVVMAGNSLAVITFGTPLSMSQHGIVSAGTSVAITNTLYSMYFSGGGASCQVPPGASVAAGANTGNIKFNGICVGLMSSNLQISLGSSVGILDSNNDYIVEPGKTVTGTIVAPGALGATTGNITY